MATPPQVKTPGTVLKELLIKSNLNQSEAATRLGVSGALLSLMISDRARITTDMAVKIERLIGGSADALAYPQLAVDLHEARAKEVTQ
ncbi:HigA family addiction module antitoxin [Caballeronia sp. M23-90]